MQTGRELYTNLQEKRRTLEQSENNYSRRLYQCEADIEKFKNEREELFEKLARIYLPSLTAQTLAKTFQEVQSSVAVCFQRKQQRRKELEAGIEKNRLAREAVQNKVAQLDRELEELAKKRADLEGLLTQQLSNNQEYMRWKELGDQACRSISVMRSRAETFNKDAQAKLLAFQTEPLFTYLVKKDYSGRSYRSFPFIRFFDNWVASKVNFNENKRNYDKLQALPGFIETELKNRQEELDNIISAMRAIENSGAAAVGLKPILEKETALLASRKAALEPLPPLDKELAELREDLEALDTEKDSFHLDALSKLKQFLKCESYQDLKKRALATPSPEDEAIVQELEKLEQQIDRCRDDATNLKQAQHEVASQLQQMNRVDDWFRANQFNTYNSRFPSNFNFSDMIAGYLIGSVAEDVFFHSIAQNHQFEAPAHFRGSDSFGSFSSGSSGGGGSSSDNSSFSGGGFSSSDSISSGGGFSTTDSF